MTARPDQARSLIVEQCCLLAYTLKLRLMRLRCLAGGPLPGILMRAIWQDIRFGTRMLASIRVHSHPRCSTLALGIGATPVTFTILRQLLQRLPVRS